MVGKGKTMRRGTPEALRVGPGLRSAKDGREAAWVELELPLDGITPVIGGGVEAFVPDTVDRVRLQGIRGQLRWFWRALQSPSALTDASALFEKERALWGGVGGAKLGEEVSTGSDRGRGGAGGDGDEEGGRRSRVLLGVRVDQQGRDEPAGHHVINSAGKESLSWKADSASAYALFPLQIPKEDRDRQRARGHSQIPMKSQRVELRFTLSVRVMPGLTSSHSAEIPDASKDTEGVDALRRVIEEDVDGVLKALWAWVHLGGLGARTTRGFGVLAVRLGESLRVNPRGRIGRPTLSEEPSVMRAARDAWEAQVNHAEAVAKRWVERFKAPQDPSEMLSAKETRIADEILQVRNGGDIALLTGVCKALITWDGLMLRAEGGPDPRGRVRVGTVLVSPVDPEPEPDGDGQEGRE